MDSILNSWYSTSGALYCHIYKTNFLCVTFMPLISFEFLSFVIIKTYLFDIDQLTRPIKTLIQIPADSKYAHAHIVYFYSLLHLFLLFKIVIYIFYSMFVETNCFEQWIVQVSKHNEFNNEQENERHRFNHFI
jgi:hypothetical protein